MVLLLSTVGIVCCVAGIIGVWMFHSNASEKVQTISTRLEDGFQRASAANQNVRRAVEMARADVAKVRNESADLGGGAEKSRRATGVLRRQIRQQVGPRINDLGGRLAMCSDAAVAVSSLLQSFQELPLGQTSRIKPDKLEGLADQASQLSVTLGRLQGLVGEADKDASEKEVTVAASEMDLILQKCQSRLDDWQYNLDAAHEELLRVKAEILDWLRIAAIAVTVACAWAAGSQISLFAHALKWFRDA